MTKIAAMGDIMLDRNVGELFRKKPDKFLFPRISNLLSGHDIIFANLENPVGSNGTPHPLQVPHVTFCCHPDTLQVLTNLHINVVSLGNNHMLDYGEVALHETLEHLDHYGIKHVGAGRNYEEANRPLLLDLSHDKIAILSYVFLYSASTEMAGRNKPGLPDHRIKSILPRIEELRLSGHKVIVSMHWGMEYSFYPLRYQMKQARRMIDAGANLILGHGPHYPQGFEDHNDGRIIYSLGNFIFDEPYKYANRSFIYSVDMNRDGKTTDHTFHFVHLENCVPGLVSNRKKERLENLILTLSKRYKDKSDSFWKSENNKYLRDIVDRVIRMKSLKFIFLPPMSFYFDIRLKDLFAKFKLSNLLSIIRHIVRR